MYMGQVVESQGHGIMKYQTSVWISISTLAYYVFSSCVNKSLPLSRIKKYCRVFYLAFFCNRVYKTRYADKKP